MRVLLHKYQGEMLEKIGGWRVGALTDVAVAQDGLRQKRKQQKGPPRGGTP